jgi:tetrahydromethanopterin S-methyltransferase subunit F
MARLAGRNKRLRTALNISALAVTSPVAVASVGVPTKAEFDKVVTLVNELRTDHNTLVTDLKA